MSTSRAVQRTTRRRTRVLDRASAVEGCLALIEEDGASALTMRNLAGRLHVSLPTLYTVIGSREQLVIEVLDGGLRSLVGAGGGDVDTAEAAADPAHVAWAMEHPWLVDLLLEVPPGLHRSLCDEVASREGLAGGEGGRLEVFVFALEAAIRAVRAERVSVEDAPGLVGRLVGAFVDGGA